MRGDNCPQDPISWKPKVFQKTRSCAARVISSLDHEDPAGVPHPHHKYKGSRHSVSIELDLMRKDLRVNSVTIMRQLEKHKSKELYYDTVSIGVLAHPLDWLSRLDCSTTKRVSLPKRAVFERSRREISLDVSVGVHILLVVERSSLEGKSRRCAKTPILLRYLGRRRFSDWTRSNESSNSTGKQCCTAAKLL